MSLIINPTTSANLVVQCRVRGRGPVEISLPVGGEADPGVTRRVLELLTLGGGAAVPAEMPAELALELAQAGLLIDRGDVTPPDPHFACPLSGELPALLPEAVQRPLVPDGPLQAAPGLRIEGDTLFACDPGPETTAPYVLDERTAAALGAIVAGTPLPAGFARQELASLLLANIVGPPSFVDARRAQWKAKIEAARAQLEHEQHAVVREFLNPVELAALRTYYRALLAAEAFIPGDGQVQARDWIHEESLARVLHRRILGTINQLTPEPLQPSYSYTARYYPGAVLRRHTDRPQCEWNASLVLDTTPEVGREDAWPIYLEPPGGPVRVQLAMGDFVLYRGTRVPHWRDAQPAGRYTTVCFFHFVGLDFVGPLA